VAHLKARGWLAACNFELMDENEGTDNYVAVHRALHELVPELRLMSYGAGPVSHAKAALAGAAGGGGDGRAPRSGG